MTSFDKPVEEFFFRSYQNWAGETVSSVEPLPAHGSDRRYFRLSSASKSAIAALNHDRKENDAFLTFSDHFASLGLPVPAVYARDLDLGTYLEQDLGDETLFSYLSEVRKEKGFSEEIISVYRKALGYLPGFQVKAGKDLDYSKCYPRSKFDRQSMMWDLNYFKYYFLKLSDIRFDEHELENDFIAFTDFLLETETDYFLYRDFQSRNIMLHNNDTWFIDYQGGRRGALQYDVASLLYDAKADIPQEVRNSLLEHYLDELEKHIPVDRPSFHDYYHGYVLVRIMQALGAYGYRGYYQKKKHFLLSIPYAINNLDWLNKNVDLPVDLPQLKAVWRLLVDTHKKKEWEQAQPKLTVNITSFSYKRGYPQDTSGNGGGFVFDCRALKNPGRFEEYMRLTGNDDRVIKFLNEQEPVQKFLENMYSIVDTSIDNYIERNFTNLMVAFGCTGGQHRSVYCANRLLEHINGKYPVKVQLTHREIEDGTVNT